MYRVIVTTDNWCRKLTVELDTDWLQFASWARDILRRGTRHSKELPIWQLLAVQWIL